MTDLTNWLDPFHDFLRPRAEATKQSAKNSHSPNDAAPSNGHGRKPDDAPQITEPPDSILSYFKSERLQHFVIPPSLDVSVDAHTKFTGAVEAARPIHEILHIAALAQEVN